MRTAVLPDKVEPSFSAELARLARLASRPNWDDEGASPISQDLWQRAKTLADGVGAVSKLGLPRLSPCGDGSIHMSWMLASGGEFQLEIALDKVTAEYTLMAADKERKYGSFANKDEIFAFVKKLT